MPKDRTATIHRMVLPDHICPFGVRAKQMLEEAGYEVEDHQLKSREQVDAFKAKHGLRTTPLIFMGNERIGGSDDLEKWLSAQT